MSGGGVKIPYGRKNVTLRTKSNFDTEIDVKKRHCECAFGAGRNIIKFEMWCDVHVHSK